MSPRVKESVWREFFVNQLIMFEDERLRFLDAYFPDFGNGRSQADQLLSDYIQVLKSHLASEEENWCGKVLVGSRVIISYLDDMSTETLTIVNPHHAVLPEDGSGECPVSFLSPMGRELLMKPCGELVHVQTPSGRLPVRIEEIGLSETVLAAGDGE
ncbi:MAG: transcription elongation factor GreA/GreB [Paenibacillaceae bacterium]|jgi:transcription elongation factor GreA|nr:transcription elongation factor GreA/GreB [Paenibacillaceae bacterium]